MSNIPRARPLALQACSFHHLTIALERIALELQRTRRAPCAAEERIAVLCTGARLLSSADELSALEAAPVWERQITGAVLLKRRYALWPWRAEVA